MLHLKQFLSNKVCLLIREEELNNQTRRKDSGKTEFYFYELQSTIGGLLGVIVGLTGASGTSAMLAEKVMYRPSTGR
jgi:hypothetical protein